MWITEQRGSQMTLCVICSSVKCSVTDLYMCPLLDLSPRSLLFAPVYPSSTWGLFVLHGAHVSILVGLSSCSALTQYHSWICAVALATAVLPGARPGWSLLPESAITAAVFKCLRGPRGPPLGHRLLLSRTAWADRGHSHNPRDGGHHLLHAEAAVLVRKLVLQKHKWAF